MFAAATQSPGILTGQLLAPHTLPNIMVLSIGCQTLRIHEIWSQRPTFVSNIVKIIIFLKGKSSVNNDHKLGTSEIHVRHWPFSTNG